MGMLVGGFFGQGSAGCDAGSSNIVSIDDLVCMPDNAFIGARWHSDGEVEFYEGETHEGFVTPDSGGQWIGGCSAADYEGRWIFIEGNFSADGPDTFVPAEDVWGSMSTGVSVEWNKGSGRDNGELQFQLRRVSDQVTILTDNFLFDVEAEDPTPK